MKKRIYIVDDHPIVRGGLSQLINLEEDLIVCGEAAEAAEAMQGISKTRPDVVLVDISLKGTSGIELTRNLLARHPEIAVLIISMYDESVYLERALRAGAKGYLTKQEATDHVVTAIRKVAAGDIYVTDPWRDKLVNKFVSGGAAKGSPVSLLTDRELEVLQLVGQGYATQKIAEELHVSGKTIESHYANIKDKLDLKNFHELIHYAVTWSLAEEQKS